MQRNEWGYGTFYSTTRWHQTLDITWQSGAVARFVMPNPDDVHGFGVELFKFADGTQLTAGQMVALAGGYRGLIEGTHGNDSLTGTSATDWIFGFAGNDILHGGDDRDFIFSGVDDSILYGDAGNDALSGGIGNDWLDGGDGDDSMTGGMGDDVYIVESASDSIIENPDSGTDSVQSSVTYTLAANVESLTLTGTAAINGTGNELDNVLRGNSARNVLSGLDGNDTIYAGDGDGAFGGEGNDTLISENTNSWTALSGEGGDDVLIGGAGSGGFFGGLGNDTITGGLGMNFIWGDDQAVAGGGNDTITGGNDYDFVIAGVGDDVVYGLGGDDNLSGNQGNDTLYGGAGDDFILGGQGDDFLDGGTGADTMTGGAGNDTYVVDDLGDVVTETSTFATEIDSVQSSITYTLGANVENLTLTGTAAINGTGNGLANVVTGNGAANILNGGLGADTLIGGLGNDTYVIGRGYAADTIVENDTTAGNTDVAQFLSGVSTDQIWFQHVGNNLEASIIGTTDKLVVKDWYLASANHVEQFKTTDGAKTLLDSNVQNLVNAMASFAPPAAGQTTLPTAYQTTLAPVFAANWQ
ncbi:MAG: hypothetical protein B7Y50_11740 [Hydrogenophilales bacterium 28-61-11]|nr:MAG: hypothetical protein B7Y50_11740 [Hydrogenophilales bacterium 28-61-11]